MGRYLLRLSYHGAPFHGFAPNDGVPTVAGALSEALATFLRHDVAITCAGRTDAGVHALDQVVHFDTDRDFEPSDLQRALNGLCKPHIVVSEVAAVDDDFDARFGCTGRTYRYRILNRFLTDPFRREVTWRVPGPLDVGAMNDAGAHLLGTHDFSSFCRRQIVNVASGQVEKSRTRDLRVVDWTREADDEVHLTISASAFCQQMVRSITGLCVDVGLGRQRAAAVPQVLAAKDRTAVPRVAPPHGLFLIKVTYPDR